MVTWRRGLSVVERWKRSNRWLETVGPIRAMAAFGGAKRDIQEEREVWADGAGRRGEEKEAALDFPFSSPPPLVAFKGDSHNKTNTENSSQTQTQNQSYLGSVQISGPFKSLASPLDGSD
ncbi:hypothetical protein OIU84_027704, partial [Salix udensis]